MHTANIIAGVLKFSSLILVLRP